MPLDVRQAKFTTVMRGYDRQEVGGVPRKSAEGYDQALRENERLRQEIARLEGSLGQFRDLEGSLKNTLMSAQKLADDLRENASKESSRIVRDAEGRAEMMRPEGEREARRRAARDRRLEDEAPRGGDRNRSDDLCAHAHAGVHARAGSARAAGQGAHASPAPRSSDCVRNRKDGLSRNLARATI